MVSPQHQKVDDISSSDSTIWNSEPIRPPALPSVLGDHQSENTETVKNPNKRTFDQLEKDEEQETDSNNNSETRTPHSKSYSESKVVLAQVWHDNPDEDYKMSSKERGYCLIVNNVNFESHLFKERKGSDVDAYRLRKVFQSFGFEVDCKRNYTCEKMQRLFRETASLCKPSHDALVVILLSHGTEHGIYGTDTIELPLNDVLTCFDNKNCKNMRGKPKLFIVQACRGQMVDYGVANQTQLYSQGESQPLTMPVSQFNYLGSQVFKTPHWSRVDKDHNPVRTDMVLCFSTQFGYVSHRNEEDGSWLGTLLAMHLRKEAYRRHFIDIMNMVSRDIRACRSTDGLKQVPEVILIGFDKNLYFNPGLFK